MRPKKRLIMLLTSVLMTMAVSAATIELNDAQWSSMGEGEFTEPGFSGSVTATDYPSDPGYRWDVNVVEAGAGYGLLGIGSTTNTLGMIVTPGGDTWSVDFTNPGTNPANYSVVAMAAYVTTDYGYTGWVIRPQDLQERIYEGETKTVEWDFASGETLTQQILPITSVQKIGLLFIGDAGGASGGAGEDIAIIVGSPAEIVLNDAQWSSMVVEGHNPYFSGSITSTTNYPRDPGYGWDLNVIEAGGGYGLFGIGADTNTMGITVSPGELWSVDFTNPGTDPMNYNGVTLAAYVTTAVGHTGWVVRPLDGQEDIYEGESKTLDWDLTTGDVLGDAAGLPITSVLKLGLVFIGDLGGASGGAGEDFSIIVGSTEPVEVVPYDFNFWLADEYPGFDTDNGKTDNPDGDALDNWNEYAFGGNPTNGNDTGYPIEYGPVAGGAFMAYVYPQRIECVDLEYVVETCDDLVNGFWTNENIIISGTNDIFATDFAGVTNLIPTDITQCFIRIRAVEN